MMLPQRTALRVSVWRHCIQRGPARRSMSAFSQMSDSDPKVLQEEKEKLLKQRDKFWNEKLATQSEASVKADKDNMPMNDMIKNSLKQLREMQNQK
ncbi:hypothetical protein BC940DRAFT_291142 [Gongronella butleri]|nr:hypothetical protein BC940DRAFT_291142 [Gongronella butleri]